MYYVILQTPYKDFRLSHIQVDASYDSKVVGYYLTNTQDSCGLKNTRVSPFVWIEAMREQSLLLGIKCFPKQKMARDRLVKDASCLSWW
jgi:hypothetical protein